MNKKQLRILIAPLDWGLGHVTRCVPIIRHLQSLNHSVVFAGNDTQQEFIKGIFKNIESVYLEGYNVQYAQTKAGFLPKIISQIPKILKKIKAEKAWLSKTIQELKIDAVISDNRYGLNHPKTPCSFITHQLQIKTGYGIELDKILLNFHYKYIEKFSNCWVVDLPDEEGISGTLGHPKELPKINTKYIGLLSQCYNLKSNNKPSGELIVLILLSGTEPQRTLISDLLWKKAIKSEKHIIFVEGQQNIYERKNIPNHISYHKQLSNLELNKAINAADIVICRSGYSSIMDLIAARKKAILIPTPGQTEQEYLAKYLNKKKYFMSAQQQKFDIQTSLLNASLFAFENPNLESAFILHQSIINDWLNDIKMNA